MSKYLLNKFLFTVDRDPELTARYLADPEELVSWWEAEYAGRLLGCHTGEATTSLALEEAERQALVDHDYVTLFEMGAHPFLTLTLFIAMYEPSATEPLGFQREYALKLAHFGLPHPDIAT